MNDHHLHKKKKTKRTISNIIFEIIEESPKNTTLNICFKREK
jgi:hypothetical protein